MGAGTDSQAGDTRARKARRMSVIALERLVQGGHGATPGASSDSSAGADVTTWTRLLAWLSGAITQSVASGHGPAWLAVAFGGGIITYFALPHEPSHLALWVVTAGLGVAAWRARFGSAFGLVCFAAFALFGTAYAAQTTHNLLAPQLLEETATGVVGRIIKIEQRTPSRVRLTLDRVQLNRVDAGQTPARVRFTAPAPIGHFAVGETIDGFARLGPPPEPAMPGARNLRRDLYFQQIGATGFAFGTPRQVEQASDPETGLMRFQLNVDQTRLALQQRFGTSLSGDTAALASALLVGKRDQVSDEAYEALRRAGLAHLLAISGMHMAMMTLSAVGFVVLAGAWSARWASSHHVQTAAALAGLAVACGYLMLSGASTATQRAFVMVVLVLLAMIARRRALTLRAVAFAAIIVLFIEPSALLGPSFQMSFAATTALVAVYASASHWNHPAARWLRFSSAGRARMVVWPVNLVAGIAATSLIAGLATAPFAAYHFSQAAPLGVLGNVLALPIVSLLIMPAGLLALMLTPFALEGLPLQAMGIGIDAVMEVARWVAALDASLVPVAAMKPSALLAVTGAGVIAAALQGRARCLALIPLAVLPLTGIFQPTPLVLIERSGATVAIVQETDGNALALDRSVRRGSSFAVGLWHQRLGIDEGQVVERSAWTCDALGCVAPLPGGGLIAHVHHEAALVEDCQVVDVLVTSLIAPGACGAALIIDAPRLLSHGAIALIETDETSGRLALWPSFERRTRPWETMPTR